MLSARTRSGSGRSSYNRRREKPVRAGMPWRPGQMTEDSRKLKQVETPGGTARATSPPPPIC
ncbi:hypothetical protein FA95DRAFT_1567910 [Auriscalpium vulgare]|uniref:Uncharacterized protein n=1 Tax=Auriscalpium vulgare TaxID=40419 RepID=A0ACB8R2E4_9AGAM|nr:hypothetical protein FA95DRAFT_1567910 [Auriscalpium vulgare]